MQRLVSFLLGCVVGGIVIMGALKYHLVRADDGLHLVPKTQAVFTHTYVDIRDFGFEQWQSHADVAIALGRAGKTELLGEAARQSLSESVESFWRDSAP